MVFICKIVLSSCTKIMAPL